ncbi:TRAP transporter permease [Aminobacterium colombiense]|uniref:TRAP transporter, 4TM/12TM fusion protein n=1 Tax=Aminobacterium colombiense (strain DSM 12261 / ALA-1) TaxID=572547 RepID=D5EES3_AMICL|nr:TRAP transporter fused permease subunit [Aminobacterium colombiense]ADE57055.1 TRAP transporter, 4TM/12TM fusion protein [Aminobacterium colombiense DSM 12261]
MRKLDGFVAKALYVYVLAMGFFHLYTAVFGTFEAFLQRAIHLTWVLPMAFVLYPLVPFKKDQLPDTTVPWYDWILAAASAAPGLYIMINYDQLMMRMQGVDELTTAQLILGTMLIVLLLEATRRIVGLPLVIVALVFTVYTYVCDASFLPSVLRGVPTEFDRIIEGMFLTDEGIFSSSLGVSATFVMIFLIFGGFLEKSGVGEYFMEFAQAFTGTAAGGPAKIAVVSSALFGSISGSAVANVYATGSFTIPLMKRIGYQPHFAGAVEAVASAGGQIMPPIMGAGAFVMAALLGVPFNKIMVAAILPSLFYYGAVLLMVHLTAVKDGLKGLPADELPSKKAVFKRLYMMSPVVLLVYMLLLGYTPMYGAIAGITLAWALSLINPTLRMGPKKVLEAIHDGSENIPIICTACASAGLVVGSVALSGIGFKFVSAVISIARGNSLLALILIALVSLILGMGLPTTSAYILGAALGVPALVKMGFLPIAAHLFVFYYAIVSNITPPVALAAYAAASIADSSPNKTGFAACKLGILAFIVPFAFCYDPGLILQGVLTENLTSLISGIGALTGIAFALTGYARGPLPLWHRTAFAISALAALYHHPLLSMASVVFTVFLFMLSKPKVVEVTC